MTGRHLVGAPLRVRLSGCPIVFSIGTSPQERIDFLRCRREADEIVIDATHQRFRRRIRRGLQMGGLDLRENKPVDVAPRPGGVFHRWNGGIVHRHVAPELFPFRDAQTHLLFSRRRGGGHDGSGARIGRSHLYPLLEDGDFLVRQLALLGHLQVAILVAHGADEQTLVRLPRHNGRPGVPALHPAVADIEP